METTLQRRGSESLAPQQPLVGAGGPSSLFEIAVEAVQLQQEAVTAAIGVAASTAAVLQGAAAKALINTFALFSVPDVAEDATTVTDTARQTVEPREQRELQDFSGRPGEPNAVNYDLASRSERVKAMFEPKVIAVVGATDKPGSVGAAVIRNLEDFAAAGGRVYYVNINRDELNGQRCFSCLEEIPEVVDLAVVVTPAHTVPGVAADANDARVGGFLCLSAGFREVGPSGRQLENGVLRSLGDVPMNGPNCLGAILAALHLNATFAGQEVRPGSLAFISQSGALVTAALEHSISFGFLDSAGAMASVKWADVVDYVAGNPNLNSIVGYVEGIGDEPEDVRRLMEAAAASTKPTLFYKAGGAEAAKASASHTGAMASPDDILDALFARAGIVRLQSLSELFDVAKIAAVQPVPRGNNLWIVTNAGGPGVATVSALTAAGGALAGMGEAVEQELGRILPDIWSHGNPVDVIGDAGPQRFLGAIEVLLRLPQNGSGLLVVVTRQAQTDPQALATGLIELLRRYQPEYPVMVSLMGEGPEMSAAKDTLVASGVPVLAQPDAAAVAFARLAEAARLRAAARAPLPIPDYYGEARRVSRGIVDQALAAGRRSLTEFEAKRMLTAWGIPVSETFRAANEDEAVLDAKVMRAAGGAEMRFVVKLDTSGHKTDVGGVIVGVSTDDEIKAAVGEIRRNAAKHGVSFEGVTIQPMADIRRGNEILLGGKRDAVCGPVVMFGPGGTYAEERKAEMRLTLAPMSGQDAAALMEGTPMGQIIKRTRDQARGEPPDDIAALNDVIQRLSWMLAADDRIVEFDANPALSRRARDGGPVVLDARAVLSTGLHGSREEVHTVVPVAPR